MSAKRDRARASGAPGRHGPLRRAPARCGRSCGSWPRRTRSARAPRRGRRPARALAEEGRAVARPSAAARCRSGGRARTRARRRGTGAVPASLDRRRAPPPVRAPPARRRDRREAVLARRPRPGPSRPPRPAPAAAAARCQTARSGSFSKAWASAACACRRSSGVAACATADRISGCRNRNVPWSTVPSPAATAGAQAGSRAKLGKLAVLERREQEQAAGVGVEPGEPRRERLLETRR